MSQSINRHILDSPQMLYDYMREQERLIADLRRTVETLGRDRSTSNQPASSAIDVRSIRDSLQSNGLAPLNVTGLIGRLNEAQDARIPRLTSHPDPLQVTYDLYILVGSPDTLWGINRDVNPPTRYQIIVVTNEFADNVFRVYDEVDTTKKVSLNVGALVTTGNVRVMTVPDIDQILAGRNVNNAFSVLQTFANGVLISVGSLTFSAAASKLIPGGTSFSVRNNADSADNLLITDAGNATIRGTALVTGTFQSNGLASLLGGAVFTVLGVSSNVTLGNESFVSVDTSGGARTLNLPAAPTAGAWYIVMDNTGNAGANNITVSGNGKNINGAASKTIAVNRNGLGLFYNGTQWDGWVLTGA